MAKTFRPGRSVNEGQLGLVTHTGGGQDSDIYLHTAAKPDGWELGDRRQLADGRVFYLAMNYATMASHGTCDYGHTMTSRSTIAEYATTNCQGGDEGSYTIKGTKASVSEGTYAGGFMFLKDATNTGTRKFGRKIVSNTASATVDGVANTVIFTLDGTLPCPMTTSDTFEVCENSYYMVEEGGGQAHAAKSYARFVGVSPCTGKVAANDYLWLQTWGEIAWMSASATNEGGVGHERNVYALGNGAINVGTSGTAAVAGGVEATGMQHIGMLMTKTSSGNDLSSMFYLTIAP